MAEKQPDGLTFRDATEDDYEAVLAIDNNLHDGIDYLPALYHRYLKDPSRYAYVTEKDGKIVAFAICPVMDDGTTMWLQATRTDPKYQNQGIMNSLCSWNRQRTLERVPTVRSVLSIIKDAKTVEKIMQRAPTHKLLTKRMILCMDISFMEITNLLNSEKFRHAQRECHADTSTVLTAQQAREILERREINTNKMVPEGVWIVGMREPFGFFTSNYKKMINNEVVITREPNDQHVVAISFSDHYRCNRGTLFYAHFYSEMRGLDSLPLIKAHILKHVSIIPQYAQTKDVVLMIVVPLDGPTEETKTFLHDYLNLRKMQSVLCVEDGLITLHCCSSPLSAVSTKANM